MNKYSSYSPEQLQQLFSNYLIDGWSYSKVTTFCRNEKQFERCYIYCEKSRSSASSVAGSAYHSAVELFFNNIKLGISTSQIEMETTAYNYIDSIPANQWQIQKSTPTIEDCILKATKNANAYISNFYKEKDIYALSEIHEVIGVELKCQEWLIINGVDIPLPCNAVIDLVVRLKDNRIVIIDHKGKSKFADEDEIALTYGKQAIIYAKVFESKFLEEVNEVWFIENKNAENKDKSAQLHKHIITIDNDTKKLYEAFLYDNLKRMIEAVGDPDYVYTINDSDNFCDKAELYNFWTKTLIAEVDDFEVPENKRELIARRLRKVRDASIANISPKTISTFQKNAAAFINYDLSVTNMNNSEKIEHILRTFSIITKVAHEIDGFSCDTYLLEVSAGIKIGNIMKYKLDIANALNVTSVRISNNLVIYEDKAYLAIEVSKKRKKDLYFDSKYVNGLKIPLGVDNYGKTVVWDLENNSTPHMLICGATGSGKSVCIKSTIEFAKLAGIKNIIIFDPKYEFCSTTGASVFNDIKNIEEEMKRLVTEMQSRAKTGRNDKVLVIFDEFADALSMSRSGKELDIKEMVVVGQKITNEGMIIPKRELKVIGQEKSLEENLKILLQKGRSLGFRIVAATQRASVKVITGDAKVNFPVQVCFRVPKSIDSKVVLDEEGAESLTGRGDGMIKSPEYVDNIVRFQGFYKK